MSIAQDLGLHGLLLMLVVGLATLAVRRVLEVQGVSVTSYEALVIALVPLLIWYTLHWLGPVAVTILMN